VPFFIRTRGLKPWAQSTAQDWLAFTQRTHHDALVVGVHFLLVTPKRSASHLSFVATLSTPWHALNVGLASEARSMGGTLGEGGSTSTTN